MVLLQCGILATSVSAVVLAGSKPLGMGCRKSGVGEKGIVKSRDQCPSRSGQGQLNQLLAI